MVNHKFARRFLFAIKAFNVEISQIRDRTKQDQLAVIRLQFWQDAIESIFTNTNFTYSGEPVLEEIQKVKRKKEKIVAILLIIISVPYMS